MAGRDSGITRWKKLRCLKLCNLRRCAAVFFLRHFPFLAKLPKLAERESARWSVRISPDHPPRRLRRKRANAQNRQQDHGYDQYSLDQATHVRWHDLDYTRPGQSA